MPTVLTVQEVAKILQIRKISACQAITCGDVPSVRGGRGILISQHALKPMPITSDPKLVRIGSSEVVEDLRLCLLRTREAGVWLDSAEGAKSAERLKEQRSNLKRARKTGLGFVRGGSLI